jgi:hypothetical protein
VLWVRSVSNSLRLTPVKRVLQNAVGVVGAALEKRLIVRR